MKFISKLMSIPSYMQIFIGMIVGISLGMIALYTGFERFIQNWIQPWGQLFIRLLQLIAVPLVFISLIKGVMGLNDINKFSRLGGKTILIYIATTICAVLLGMTMGLIVKPGAWVDKSRVAALTESYHAFAEEKKQAAELTQDQSPLAFLNDIVPDNIVNAMSDNSKMLQIIFFAILFGMAALTVSPGRIKPVVSLLDGLNDIILRMVDFIIRLAPIGVLALMAGLVVDFKGDGSIFSALAIYAITVVVSLFILLLVFYPMLVHFFTKTRVTKFLKAMYPVQLVAFTTSSSAATLPVNMETVEKKLNVSNETCSFVLPVGVTINMDGTSCYQTIAILFIAQVLGIDLSLQQLLIVIGMTVLSSIGTPGIPGGSYVILAMVLTAVGIPVEGLAIILGIDRPLDMLRTSVNVTGDAAVALMVDKKTK